MKTKHYLLISLIIISVIAIFGVNNTVLAAGANLAVSGTNTETGKTVSLSAVISDAASWDLDVQTSGGTLAKSDARVGTTDDGKNGNKTVNLGTFTANEAGRYTITLSGTVVDGNTLSIKSVSGSIQIDVSKPEEKQNENQGQNENQNQGGNENQNQNQGQNQEEQKPVEVTPDFTSVNLVRYINKETSSANLRASWSTSSTRVANVPTGTQLTITATSTKTVNGYVWYRVNYNGTTCYIASNLLTDVKPEEKKEEKKEEEKKSSNVFLKELKVNLEGLTPAFDKNVKEYTLKVGSEVEKIDVTAKTEDDKSKAEVAGADSLKTGENVVLVTVSAEDGTTTIYQIKVTKEAVDGLKLTKLEVKDYSLSPKFDPDVFEYKLNVTDTQLEKLNIVTEASQEKATVEVVGNEKLAMGDNVITIMVKSEDGTKTVTYQLTVTKKEPVKTVTETNKKDSNLNKIIIIVAVLIVAVVIGIIAYIVINKIRNSKVENDNYYSGTYDEDDQEYDTIQNYDEEESYEEDYNDDDDDTKGNGKGKHF